MQLDEKQPELFLWKRRLRANQKQLRVIVSKVTVLLVYVTVRITHVSQSNFVPACVQPFRTSGQRAKERSEAEFGSCANEDMPVEKILEAELAVEPKTETYVEANLSAPANSVSQSLPLNHTRWHSTFGEHLAHLKCAVSELHISIAPQWASRQVRRKVPTCLQMYKKTVLRVLQLSKKESDAVLSISLCE